MFATDQTFLIYLDDRKNSTQAYQGAPLYFGAEHNLPLPSVLAQCHKKGKYFEHKTNIEKSAVEVTSWELPNV